MQYTKSVATIDKALLYLVAGQDAKGRDAFYYVLVDKLKQEIFLRDVNKSDVDLRRFGRILISGFGHEPTEDAKAYIKNEFGVDVK